MAKDRPLNTVSAAQLLALQGTAGNQAVRTILSKKVGLQAAVKGNGSVPDSTPLGSVGSTTLFVQRDLIEQRNPQLLSPEQAFQERNLVLRELERIPSNAPERADLIAYARALEQRANQGSHTGGGAAGINTAIDSHVRIRHYVEETQQMSRRILDDLEAGRITHEEARNLAASQRNQILNQARARLTPGGRAMSEALKEEGRGLDSLLTTYSERIVRANPDRFALTPAQLRDSAAVRRAADGIRNTPEVSRAIVEAAGRSNRAMTLFARVGRVAGPAGGALSLASSGYEVMQAQPGYDRARVITRETGGFAGGWLAASGGSLAAAWAASLVCGPGMVVCALAISLVIIGGSGYVGGRTGEWVAEEAFTAVTQAPVPAATLWGAGGGYSGLMRRDFERAFGQSRQPPPSSGGQR